jgi:DNA-binding protein H-NS
MNLPSFDGMSVEDLRNLIAGAQKRLRELEEEERQRAINQIRELASAAGLKITIGDDKKKGRSSSAGSGTPAKQAQPLPAGARFVHPDNPDRVWIVGRGRKPGWVAELEEKGVKPLPAEKDSGDAPSTAVRRGVKE